MRLAGIDNIAPNTLLGKNVYNDEGLMLLREGTPLKTHYLERMEDMGYFGAVIDDPLSAGVEISDAIPEGLRREGVETIRSIYSPLLKGGQLFGQSSRIYKLADNIFDAVNSLRTDVLNLRDLKSLGEYLYQHSVNVAVLAIFIGKGMGLATDALRDLSRAALLHDIGMAEINKPLLSKRGTLSEDEMAVVKGHPTTGINLLKEGMRASAIVYVAVLQHHERFDKSGYPNQRGGFAISPLARIVSVADCFDALTSTRYHRGAFSPADAYEYIMGNSGTLFDPDVVSAFSRRIAPFADGSTVKLSDGRMAIVLENNSNFILRPIIRVIEEDQSFTMIDLSRQALELTITDVI